MSRRNERFERERGVDPDVRLLGRRSAHD